ncbi:MAG: hypothetical protein ACI856_000462, partial [Kiritimatiellia bacterium]
MLKHSSCRNALRLCCLYAGASLLLHLECFLPGRSLFRWDAWVYTFPLLLEAREQILSGQMPFWAPSFCNGTPLLANINAAVFYPPKLLVYALPLSLGYALFLTLHTWLAMVGMHLLLRIGLSQRVAPAVCGALIYAACGYARGMCDTLNVHALPWIPLGLAALLWVRSPRQRRWAPLLFGLAVLMLVLGGDIQALVIFGLVALPAALMTPRRRHSLRVLILGGVIALALSAPQWLPTVFVTTESYRASGIAFSDATELSFHPMRCVEFWVPHRFGTHALWNGEHLMGQGATKLMPWTASVHIGRLALVLACLAVWRYHRRWDVRWALGVAVLSLVLAFGRFMPGFHVWHELPLVGSFRYPEKYLLWTSLGLSLLAAMGVDALCALWRKAHAQRAWKVAVVGLAGMVLVGALVTGAEALVVAQAALCAIAMVAVLLGVRSRRPTWLIALVALELCAAWQLERPSSAQLNMQDTPFVAEHIRRSGDMSGRFVRDPAARQMAPRQNPADVSRDAQLALWHRAHLTYNMPRRFGLRSADGFSPLELAAARGTRLAALQAAENPDAFIAFCKSSAARWVLTTQAHAETLSAALDARVSETWGDGPGATVLLHRPHAYECTFLTPASDPGAPNRLMQLRPFRLRPGYIRIDLPAPFQAGTLTVRETFSRGWRAATESGQTLAVSMLEPSGMMRLQIPAGTTQVRMRYVPMGWEIGLLIFGAGLLILFAYIALCLKTTGLIALLGSTRVATLCVCLLALVLGCLARSHWACTFDEGFHVTRGTVRAVQRDSRLSYFHPPLQNMIGGYFGKLAHGTRLSFPDTPDWKSANVFQYATTFAASNPSTFPSLVKATRWGTSLFFMLLVVVCACWGGRAAGALGAWVCGLGIGLNPNLLAHGNLTTTDMGVLALGVAGTHALWRASARGTHADQRARANGMDQSTVLLSLATLAFAASAMVKFTGLIWLGGHLLFVVPLLAWRQRSWQPLWQWVLAAVSFLVLLVGCYGLDPQAVRAPAFAWLNGSEWIGGRYLEGIVAQGTHAFSGHRGFFMGEQFMQGRWWYLPVAMIFKTPAAWVLAGGLGLIAWCRRRRAWHTWLPWLPVMLYIALTLFANQLAIGVRHFLPMTVLMIMGGGVVCARLASVRWRRLACTVLIGSSLVTASLSFPDYISYFPAWSGGTHNGYRHL